MLFLMYLDSIDKYRFDEPIDCSVGSQCKRNDFDKPVRAGRKTNDNGGIKL